MPAKARRLDPKTIEQHIAALHREPFREALARIMQAEPSVEDMKAFAMKHPDRWGQLVAIMARAGGYTDKLITETNFYIQIAQMSDAELEARRAEIACQLNKLQAIEHDSKP